MDKYIVFVASVVKGSTFIERHNLNCTHKFFNSPEEAIAAVQDEIKRVYCNTNDVIVSEMKSPRIEKFKDMSICTVYGGGFQCKFANSRIPVFFRIYINSIHTD